MTNRSIIPDFKIKIQKVPPIRFEDIEIGSLFTRQSEWPIYLKISDRNVIIVGDKTNRGWLSNDRADTRDFNNLTQLIEWVSMNPLTVVIQ